ncbi:MAG: hypothetical protein II289_03095 [Bacteroidales bacterium]|jgi:hypothetical protein|nr:hypothetical protein [Bacteroidales bacterium]
MKRILAIVLVATAFLATENTADAQFLKNLLNKVKGTTETTATEASATTAAETASTATVDGKAAGVALRALFTQYKADGKFDMGNLNNLLNLTSLANNIQGLKGQTNKGAFYKDFASGLVMGSNNLVTEQNTTSVMDGLTNLVNNVDLSGLTQKAEETQATVAEKVASATTKANTAVTNATEIASAVTNILNIFKK